MISQERRNWQVVVSVTTSVVLEVFINFSKEFVASMLTEYDIHMQDYTTS
jgi:hypothetical protein